MTPCLFSVSYAGFWGQASLNLHDFIRHAGELGFPSVMIAGKRPHLSPLDMTPESIAELGQTLTEANVRCHVVGAYTNLMQPSSIGSEVPLVEFQIAYVEALASCAAQVGASIVRIFTAYDADGQGLQVQWNRCCSAIHAVITTNADYIRVPRHRYRPELVNYEPVSPDWVRAVPFGEGVIDYAAFFHGLRDGGFDGLATYEICSPIRGGGEIQNLDACSSRYLAWMREQNVI